MRPHGEFRGAVIRALEQGPGICRDVAARAQLSVGVAQYTLRNLCQVDVVEQVDPVRVEGVKRPVPKYRLATSPSSVDPTAALASSLAQCWAEFV
jgi:hypothetical protein